MSLMIIYPTDGYHLTKKQYSSIFGVVKKYQNSCYCISDIEFEDCFTRKGNNNELGYTHKVLTDFSYDEYRSQDRLFENALYDLDEKWGITIFQDYFGIIFGEDKIISEIKSHYSNADDLQEFNKFLNSTEILNLDLKNELLILLSNSM